MLRDACRHLKFYTVVFQPVIPKAWYRTKHAQTFWWCLGCCCSGNGGRSCPAQCCANTSPALSLSLSLFFLSSPRMPLAGHVRLAPFSVGPACPPVIMRNGASTILAPSYITIAAQKHSQISFYIGNQRIVLLSSPRGCATFLFRCFPSPFKAVLRQLLGLAPENLQPPSAKPCARTGPAFLALHMPPSKLHSHSHRSLPRGSGYRQLSLFIADRQSNRALPLSLWLWPRGVVPEHRPQWPPLRVRSVCYHEIRGS